MITLNTRQRDMLRLLLKSDQVIVINELAEKLGLTPRQVNYGMKGVRQWLSSREISLEITPGVGLDLNCTSLQREELFRELQADTQVDLVLTAGQRQQLIGLRLLRAATPLKLGGLQKEAQVSRSTIIKDLEQVEAWLDCFGLIVERRPNTGIWLTGQEHKQRHALTALLWGEVPFDHPIWSVSQAGELVFSLAHDAELLPVLKQVQVSLKDLNLPAAMDQVANIEADIGGRFTDHEVIYLALILAIQGDRIRNDRTLTAPPCSPLLLYPFENGTVWNVVKTLLQSHYPQLKAQSSVLQRETAFVTIHLLASAKNDRWPSDSETEQTFEKLISQLLRMAGDAYGIPTLQYDAMLRDGLIANLIPACLRNIFGLWTPKPRTSAPLSVEKYAYEYEVARVLMGEVKRSTGINLGSQDVNNLVLLLRAAYIRERPHELKDVLVVCPSGMATAQLLVARLRARFPHIGHLNIVSLRELSESRLKMSDLIITTVPLPEMSTRVKIIQVHPLLLPEDINAITDWLAQ